MACHPLLETTASVLFHLGRVQYRERHSRVSMTSDQLMIRHAVTNNVHKHGSGAHDHPSLA